MTERPDAPEPPAPDDAPDAAPPVEPAAADAPAAEPAATPPRRSPAVYAVAPLLGASLRQWLGAKGFWMVTAAALLPLALTGAWVATHQANVEATSLAWTPEEPVVGDTVVFTGIVTNVGSSDLGAFNVSLGVGRVQGQVFSQLAGTVETVDALPAGASANVTFTWTAQAGLWYVLLTADSEDALGEIEELNNQKIQPLLVRNVLPSEEAAPRPPADLLGPAAEPEGTGPEPDGEPAPDAEAPQDPEEEAAEPPADGEGAEAEGSDPPAEETSAPAVADLQVALDPVSGARPREPHTFRATVRNDGPEPVRNATLVLRVGQSFEGELFALASTEETFDLAPGDSRAVTLSWTTQAGGYWQEAFVRVASGIEDAAPEDNHRATAFTVDPALPEDPAEREPEIRSLAADKPTLTIFYGQILSYLHLSILVPLIGLFYAAGVVTDERERGTLPYLLTRPVPRWLMPIVKLVGSFLVASLALAVGIVGTFALLFGTPQGGDIGFLTTPLIVTLLGILVYGSFFLLLGVLVNRPYLVGLAFVLGWEGLAAGIGVGTGLAPWVANLTLREHFLVAVSHWRFDQGVMWLPAEEGLGALRILLVATVAFLVATVLVMKKKEFEV